MEKAKKVEITKEAMVRQVEQKLGLKNSSWRPSREQTKQQLPCS